ncbi:hypothetical protein QCA50_004423 [Cerrena zonata]|uniref:Tyrosinase copper-binding domain-containing protein n=1 Tax=Cerrena zonata TaxID=2478898 RepID=A0AAW0GHL6_9APHY
MHFQAHTFVQALILSSGLIPLTYAAQCIKPSVRKEWRSLSMLEKTKWIQAVKCLTTFPHTDALKPSVNPSDIPPVNTSSTYYDDFVYIHMDLNTHIHSTGLFLPWHRWYVAVYETALKEKCGFTGVSPYWNWTMDAGDFQHATIFEESDYLSGLGGWGDPSKDFSVPDGAFSDFNVAYPSPHILRRNFTLQPFLPFASLDVFPEPAKLANTSFTYAEISNLIANYTGDFKGFQKYFEFPEGAHSSVHLIMGGDLGGNCPSSAVNCTGGPTFSANEPLFWLHHAMVDNVWYDWQHRDASNFWAFEGGSVQNITTLAAIDEYPNGMPPALHLNSVMPADGMFSEVTIGDVFNTTGGYLCYVYE